MAVAAGVLLAFALGFAWHNFQSARRTAASLAELGEQRGQLDMSIRRARERVAARRQDAIALQNKINSAQPPKSTPGNSPQAKDPATLMASDQKLRSLYLKSFRALLAVRVAWMYQSLGLTQAQIDRFEEMAEAREDDIVTMKAAAIAQGLAQSDPGLAALQKQSEVQFYAAVASEVSVALSQALINLDRVEPVQEDATNMSFLLAPLGTPHLTGWQEAQLGQLLASASTSYQSGGNADTNTIDWDKAYDQAAALLSGPQLEGFKTWMELRQYRNKLDQFQSRRTTDSR
jgi:hypothetical protein